MGFKIIGIGEVLWDVFPSGRKLGGAPANFAYHAGALGAKSRVVSRVGDDALGREIVERLASLELPTDGVSVDAVHPTGMVTVELSEDGQPQYTIHEDAAWDHLEAGAAMLGWASEADAICFGTLGQRCAPSRAAIRAVLQASRPGALRVFDVNLRQDYYSRETILGSLEMSNVLKLNDAELPVLAELLELNGTGVEKQLAQMVDRFSLRLAVYTRGSRGSLLFDGSRWSDHPGHEVEVKDTVGAGDSLTAAAMLGTLAGWDLDTINSRANDVAAYVCSRQGATPPLPDRLAEPFLLSTGIDSQSSLS